jgi:hypothetical protein
LDEGLTRVFRTIGVRCQLSMPAGNSMSDTEIPSRLNSRISTEPCQRGDATASATSTI